MEITEGWSAEINRLRGLGADRTGPRRRPRAHLYDGRRSGEVDAGARRRSVFTINQKRIDGMGFNYFAKATSVTDVRIAKGKGFPVRWRWWFGRDGLDGGFEWIIFL